MPRAAVHFALSRVSENECKREIEVLKIRKSRTILFIFMTAFSLTIAACGGSGGGGGGGNGGTTNRAPSAGAGIDQSVVESTAVQLNGSASDPDPGDTLTIAWTQVSGTTVTINNASLAQADFLAPDVAVNTPETLTFRFTVTDAAGLSKADTFNR